MLIVLYFIVVDEIIELFLFKNIYITDELNMPILLIKKIFF